MPIPPSLLTTKLHIPAPRPSLASRSRLVARLNDAAERPLTLIAAPVGFGKTTLVSEWIAQTNVKIAWVSLDDGDNDPARFWAYVIAALQTVHTDFGDAAAELLRASPPPPMEMVITTLINDLSTASHLITLILDDGHVITSPAIHDSLTFLLDHAPPGLRLILIARSDPPLPLARYRARDQLTEPRAAMPPSV